MKRSAAFLMLAVFGQMLFAFDAAAEPHWQLPWKKNDCTAPGRRQYSSQLLDVAGSWEDACARMAADIEGQHFSQPSRCVSNAGIWGEFDDVPDSSCPRAHWGDFAPGACGGDGFRIYSSRLWDIIGDWDSVCRRMPAKVVGQEFLGPNQCFDRGGAGEWGEFHVPDKACAGFTIKGVVSYLEPLMLAPRPVELAELELWVCGARVGTACSWSKLASDHTGFGGEYKIYVPGPRDPSDLYVVRVVAANEAAIVYQQDTASPFFADLAPPRAVPPGTTVDITRTFNAVGNDALIGMHLNAAQKVRPARLFAMRYRDSSETDELGRVIIAPSVATGTPFTNSGFIHMPPGEMWNEDTLVHEYGHFVQENIGAYYPWASVHDGCEMTFAGVLENSPELAWLEGFADFYSFIVRTVYAGEYSKKTARLSHVLGGLVPYGCSAVGKKNKEGKTIGPDAVEGRVQQALTMLVSDGDGTACAWAGGAGKALDDCRAKTVLDRAALVMRIVDKEFDFSAPGQKGLRYFRDVWIKRGGNRGYINAVWAAIGIADPAAP